MSPRPISRRRVLSALVAAGGAGALTGVGTAALFGDRETFASSLGAGVVDLAIGYTVLTGPNADPSSETVVDGPAVTLPVSALTAERDSGSALLRVFLPETEGAVNNPAGLWLRTTCPPATALGELLTLTLSYADCETGDPIEQITSGPLRVVASELRNGILLDADPSTAAVDCLTDELCVLVEYELSDGYLGSEATDLAIEAYGVQCRNNDITANPFPAADPCPVGEPCPCCTYVGKVEFGDDIPTGVYAFTEGANYEVEVYDTDSPTDTRQIAFRLRTPTGDLAPNLCTVEVKGANPNATGLDDDTATYVSEGPYGNDTWTLAADDAEASPVVGGLLSAPGDKWAISHVRVYVCTPCTPDDGGPCVECGTGADDADRVGSLTFRYDGDAPTDVLVYDPERKKGGKKADIGPTTYSGVAPGDEFTALPAEGDRFSPNVELEVAVDGTAYRLHTSCSQPLYVGQVVGPFTIVAATDSRGRALCDGGER